MKEKTEDPCKQMKQISKAVLGFEEGKFKDILTGIKMLHDDCDRLRREIDNLIGVIRYRLLYAGEYNPKQGKLPGIDTKVDPNTGEITDIRAVK